NMHPELDHDRSRFCQIPFHIIDLFIGALPLCLGTESFKPLYHHASVPGPVKDRHMSVFWHGAPESPQIMMGFFDIIARCGRTHPLTSGIHLRGQTFDRAALSASIPSLASQYDRDPPAVQCTVELLYFRLQLVLLLFIIFP